MKEIQDIQFFGDVGWVVIYTDGSQEELFNAKAPALKALSAALNRIALENGDPVTPEQQAAHLDAAIRSLDSNATDALHQATEPDSGAAGEGTKARAASAEREEIQRQIREVEERLRGPRLPS